MKKLTQPDRLTTDGEIAVRRVGERAAHLQLECTTDGVFQTLVISEHNAWRLLGCMALMLEIDVPGVAGPAPPDLRAQRKAREELQCILDQFRKETEISASPRQPADPAGAALRPEASPISYGTPTAEDTSTKNSPAEIVVTSGGSKDPTHEKA